MSHVTNYILLIDDDEDKLEELNKTLLEKGEWFSEADVIEPVPNVPEALIFLLGSNKFHPEEMVQLASEVDWDYRDDVILMSKSPYEGWITLKLRPIWK